MLVLHGLQWNFVWDLADPLKFGDTFHNVLNAGDCLCPPVTCWGTKLYIILFLPFNYTILLIFCFLTFFQAFIFSQFLQRCSTHVAPANACLHPFKPPPSFKPPTIDVITNLHQLLVSNTDIIFPALPLKVIMLPKVLVSFFCVCITN